MRWFRRILSLLTAAVVVLTALPVNGFAATTRAAQTGTTADRVIRLRPGEASSFNDTDDDGLGEFEGWGTSLCWWANRIGYDSTLTGEAAKLFFGDDGLDMNIARYNVGGGDKVLRPNEKADFYGLTGANKPSYTGKDMKISKESRLKDAAYTSSDADFGFVKGSKVGEFSAIGYINEIGAADDTGASGGNLHFKVNVGEAGQYTVKLLLTLNGENKRNAAIRVNNDDSKIYTVTKDKINENRIASASGQNLFVAAIENVSLDSGENTIDIGGKAEGDGSDKWTLDFVKMAVFKNGDGGGTPRR